jgi:hypothetical protein
MPTGTAKATEVETAGRATPVPNGWLLFALICAAYFGVGLFTDAYVLTEEVYLQSFSRRLPAEQVGEILAFQERWQWVGYVLQPLLLAVKMAYTALCLGVGFVLAERADVRFGRLFKAALFSEGVFVVASATQVAWAKWVVGVETLQDFSTAAPLSALVLADVSQLSQWAVYPLQTISVFQLLYCIALAYALGWLRSERADEMFVLTLWSYGAGLVLWVVFVAFLTLQVAP